MPRPPRLDAPGALHHVMGRGIERPPIFATDGDRADFRGRVADLCQTRALIVYAWGLLPNHFHLLVRTGGQALSQSMKKLLTGYVVNFNRRHKLYGHLFQNRYKSILCEDDPYLLVDAVHPFEPYPGRCGAGARGVECTLGPGMRRSWELARRRGRRRKRFSRTSGQRDGGRHDAMRNSCAPGSRRGVGRNWSAAG